jgi:hypothetical protein
VIFQLQHGKQVKNTLPINNPHIELTKYTFQKFNKPNTLKNLEKARKMWVENLLVHIIQSPQLGV